MCVMIYTGGTLYGFFPKFAFSYSCAEWTSNRWHAT